MSGLEVAIAWRYLRSRRGSRVLSLISVIAIGGVVVGVSALILVMGVMNGLQRDLREKILVGSPDVRIVPAGDAEGIAEWRELITRIEAHPGVVVAAPFVHTQAMASAGYLYGEGAFVIGIEPEGALSGEPVTTIREHGDAREAFRFEGADGEKRGVVLGHALAARLGVYRGDQVHLVSAAGVQVSPVLGTMVPRIESYHVSGTFTTGMYEYDNGYIYMPIDAARELAGLGDAVSGIEARVTSRSAAPEIAQELEAALGAGFRAENWQDVNRSLFQALQLEKLGMGVILLLIVVVAAFNIVSTLTMVVTDKTRDIGILRTLGMTADGVRRVFLSQGVIIGAVGTGLGVLLGVTIAHLANEYRLVRLDQSLYFIDHLPVAVDAVDVAAIALASLAIAALATIYPARQAARLLPVEAIRHD